MKRGVKRNQPSFPEINALVRGIVRMPPWVFPSCSPRPADSMLQSGTLFTFWTQLTSPSLSPSVLPSPFLHFSFSVSLSLSDCPSLTSLWLQVTAHPRKEFYSQWSPENSPHPAQRMTSLLMNERRPKRFMLYSLWCHTHTHTPTHIMRGQHITTCLCSTLYPCHTFKASDVAIALKSASLLMCSCQKNLEVRVNQVQT